MGHGRLAEKIANTVSFGAFSNYDKYKAEKENKKNFETNAQNMYQDLIKNKYKYIGEMSEENYYNLVNRVTPLMPMQEGVFNALGSDIEYGNLQVQSSLAWKDYIDSGKEEDRIKAEKLDEELQKYMLKNPDVGKTIISDTAQYLPQFGYQAKSNILPAVGSAGTYLLANKLSGNKQLAQKASQGVYAVGSTITGSKASYDLAQGGIYRDLVKMGVPDEKAREISEDSAFWQTVIESGENLYSLKDIFNVSTNNPVKQRVKDYLKAYGINVLTEMGEEGTQELIGIGYEKKALDESGLDTSEYTLENVAKRVSESAIAGGKIALTMGVGETAINITMNEIPNIQSQFEIQSTKNDIKKSIEQSFDKKIAEVLENKNLVNIELAKKLQEQKQKSTTPEAINQAYETIKEFSENVQQPVQNVTSQSPNNEVQQQTNEVIPQQIENQKNANVVQNNTQIAQNTPNNVQIFQNNVQNAQDLQKTAMTGNEIQEYATKKTKDGTTYVFNQNKKFVNPDGTKMTPKQMYDSIVGKEINVENGEKIYILKTLPKKNLFQELFKRHPRFFDNINNMKQLNRMTNENIIDLIKNSNLKQVENDIDNRHAEQGIETFDTREVIFYDGENAYNIELSIANLKDGRKVAYAKKYFGLNEEMTKKIKEDETLGQQSQVNQKPLLNNIIASKTNNVNNQENLMPTIEQLQAQDQKQAEEAYNTLKMKKPKLEDIVNLTEEDVKMPQGKYKALKDKNTDHIRKFYENVETSKIISSKIKDLVESTTYEQQKNLDVLARVQEKLDKEGNSLINEWYAKDIKKATEDDVALGAVLIERYQQQGDYKSAVNVVQKLADMGTQAGRTVQMYSIFQRLTPESMLIYQQKKLSNAFEELSKKQTGEWVKQNKDKFKLTEDDATFIIAKVQEAQYAPTERQKQIALGEIEARINDKLPPEAGQSVKAFRRIAMLFNPKTQVRNVAGNVTVMPLNLVSDMVGTAIDKAIAKKTGVRTTALPNLQTIGKGLKKGATETIDDYRRGIRTTPTGTKYEIQNNAKSFNENTNSRVKNAINNKLNAIDRILSTTLELGDRPFYEAAYQNALEGQMKANNVTEPTQDMIDIASNVALSQTWQDSNNYTQAVLGIRSAFNKININGFGLGDLIIPFAKTPANLTKAMVDYSPFGVVTSIINYNDMRKAISRGDMTAIQQKRFVTSVGKAVAGTILYAIAGALVQGGAVTGSSDEDKDVANFEKNVLGIQPYSIKIGDKTFTYNWANPIATPFAIMADTYKMSEEGAKWNEILINAFRVAGDQLVANSFLQGIQELLSSEYGNESAMDNLVNALMDLPTQFTPTLFGQIATQFDSTKRQTYENGDTVGTMVNEVKNKIPGAKNTLAPQVNTFGEEIQNYGGDNNPFNVFLNPANISSTNASEDQKELYALYEVTKDKTIFPRQAPYTVEGGGEKVTLSSQDRAKYQKTSGQYVAENLGALFDSDFYKSLENEKKVEVVAKIVSDADTTAKDIWINTEATKDLAELKTELGDIPLVDYYNAWIAQKGLTADKNWKGESISGSKKKKQIKAINEAVSDDLTPKQKETLYGIFNVD